MNVGVSFLTDARAAFHAALLESILYANADGVPTIADGSSKTSVRISLDLLHRLGSKLVNERLAGQMAGSKFEVIVGEYLEATLPRLSHLRPGRFIFTKGSSRLAIADSDQYQHLSSLSAAMEASPELAVAIGMDYLIKPDVMILRKPEPDEFINSGEQIVDETSATLTSMRSSNGGLPMLHASVSCKWTIRSDRAQNARSEALNLIRNRKGRLPHIVIVTGEPTPGRLASLAFGTGDIDCVYHIALPELKAAVAAVGSDDAKEMLDTMIEGRRLRDIADLPLDLTA
ncbi:Type-2 restriction enzyme NgoMIV [Devosia equisanguinis]|uniref:Type-2 restriction enzyme NgoMIV n=1 Tax=Devosia equisanguinis TaxID=2490941 RepID=A0A447IGZ0_9HYPH|nr:Type-2 restriction enzyme NgoMIV [Devosia equisanguinis]